MNLHKHLITICYLIGIALTLSSCAKSTEDGTKRPSTYQQTFFATDVTVKNDVKLYISQLEVNNAAIKDLFLKHGAHQGNDFFALEQKGSSYLSGLASIIFISADTARLSTSTEEMYKVTRNNNQLLFTSITSALTPIIIPFPELLKYPELQKTSETSGVRRKVMVGVINNNEIKISGVAYKIAQYVNQLGVNRYNYRWGLFYNEFNPDVVKTLDVKDTLLVKEYTYIFKLR